jgi:MFS transporter, DHA1 family, multidrug resistance protein
MELQTSTSPRAEPRVALDDKDSLRKADESRRKEDNDVNSTLPRSSSSSDATEQPHSDIEVAAVTLNHEAEKIPGTHQPLQYVDNLVIFDGPDDPENPKNLPAARKWAITARMGMCTFVVTFSSSIFSVAVAPVMEEFEVSRVVATLGVALFLLVSPPRSPLT